MLRDMLDKARNYMLGESYLNDAKSYYDYDYPNNNRNQYDEHAEVEHVHVRGYEKVRPTTRLYDTAEYVEPQKIVSQKIASQKPASMPSNSSNIVNFRNPYGSGTKMSVMISHPTDVNDATYVSEYIKDNKACIVNLEGLDRAVAQRIADFLGGAVYALNGEIQRVSKDIFLVAPASVSISDGVKNELNRAGFGFLKSANFK